MMDKRYKYALLDALSRYPLLASILFDKELEYDNTVPDILFVPPNKIKINVSSVSDYSNIELSAMFLREALRAYLSHPFIYNILTDDIKKLAYLIASYVYVTYSLKGFYYLGDIREIISEVENIIANVLEIYPADKIFNYTVEEIAEKIYALIRKYYDFFKKLLQDIRGIKITININVQSLSTLISRVLNIPNKIINQILSKVIARAIIELLYLENSMIDSKVKNEYVNRILDNIMFILHDIKEKSAGKEVVCITRTLELLFTRAKINWKSVLTTVFIYEGTEKLYYTYSKLSRRSYVIDSPLPGKSKYGRNRIIVAIDTSGSISDDEYREFANEICNLVNITGAPVTVVMWEADVVNMINVRSLQEAIGKLSKRVGYGGTVISNAIKWIKDNIRDWRCSTLIIFTDGYFSDELTDNLIEGFRKVIIVLSKSGTTSKIKAKNIIITWLY